MFTLPLWDHSDKYCSAPSAERSEKHDSVKTGGMHDRFVIESALEPAVTGDDGLTSSLSKVEEFLQRVGSSGARSHCGEVRGEILSIGGGLLVSLGRGRTDWELRTVFARARRGARVW